MAYDSLINPSDVDSIAKIIMKYQLTNELGDAGMKYLLPDTQMEKLQIEQARLGVVKQRRELGYPDDNAYNADVNDNGKDTVARAALFEAKRKSNAPGGLQAVWKTAEEDILKPTFKWATFAGSEPAASKGASHVARNAILRAISIAR